MTAPKRSIRAVRARRAFTGRTLKRLDADTVNVFVTGAPLFTQERDRHVRGRRARIREQDVGLIRRPRRRRGLRPGPTSCPAPSRRSCCALRTTIGAGSGQYCARSTITGSVDVDLRRHRRVRQRRIFGFDVHREASARRHRLRLRRSARRRSAGTSASPPRRRRSGFAIRMNVSKNGPSRLRPGTSRRRRGDAGGFVSALPQRIASEVHRALRDARLIERHVDAERRIHQLRIRARVDREARAGRNRIRPRQRRQAFAQVLDRRRAFADACGLASSR